MKVATVFNFEVWRPLPSKGDAAGASGAASATQAGTVAGGQKGSGKAGTSGAASATQLGTVAGGQKGSGKVKREPVGRGHLDFEGAHYQFTSFHYHFHRGQEVFFETWRWAPFNDDLAEAVGVRPLSS